MTVSIEDLIKAGKSEVRYNSNLLTAYKKLFAIKFGREPDCAGCTFDSDWNRLINNQTSIKQEIMPNKSFKLRDNSIIYTYEREDKKNQTFGRIRSYGNIMTEEFAAEYLTFGTEEQIAERKKQFKILPQKFQDTQFLVEVSKYPEKLADMKKLAAEKNYPEEEYSNISTKVDMKSYLEGKEIDSAGSDEEENEEEEEENLFNGKTITVGNPENQPNENTPTE